MFKHLAYRYVGLFVAGGHPPPLASTDYQQTPTAQRVSPESLPKRPASTCLDQRRLVHTRRQATAGPQRPCHNDAGAYESACAETTAPSGNPTVRTVRNFRSAPTYRLGTGVRLARPWRPLAREHKRSTSLRSWFAKHCGPGARRCRPCLVARPAQVGAAPAAAPAIRNCRGTAQPRKTSCVNVGRGSGLRLAGKRCALGPAGRPLGDGRPGHPLGGSKVGPEARRCRDCALMCRCRAVWRSGVVRGAGLPTAPQDATPGAA